MSFRRSRPWRVAVWLLVAAVPPAAVTAWLHPRRPDWSRPAVEAVDLAQVRRWAPAPLWVDARPRAAFQAARAAGALPLPLEQWEEGFARVAQTWMPPQRIVVYCEEGACRSHQDVAFRLQQELGERVYVLREGWNDWEGRVR